MNLWSEHIKKMNAYVPGEQLNDKSYIKLNTNENPYPPHRLVEEAMIESIKKGLNLYSDPSCKSIKVELSKLHSIDEENIFIGNGSDEVLAFSFLAFFDGKENPLLFNDITYGFYKVYGDLFKIDYKKIPLTSNLKVNLEAYYQDNGGMIICNPNAPTGEFISLDRIEEIVLAYPESVIIVDEAYIDFGGESAIPLISKYKNLLVIQTFSKSRSLAGLRVGMAFGDQDLIKGLEKVKYSINPYSLDSVALAGATAAIKHNDLSLENTNEIIKNREYLKEELVKLGFNVLDSKTNFLFVEHKCKKGEEIYLKLKDQGVLIRYFNKERIDNFLRITIGTREEVDVLLEKLKGIV